MLVYYDGWPHVKELSNTKLLVSLHHNFNVSANMVIYDISKKKKPNRVYSFEEVFGGKIDILI